MLLLYYIILFIPEYSTSFSISCDTVTVTCDYHILTLGSNKNKIKSTICNFNINP